jgi:hypothetical protein
VVMRTHCNEAHEFAWRFKTCSYRYPRPGLRHRLGCTVELNCSLRPGSPVPCWKSPDLYQVQTLTSLLRPPDYVVKGSLRLTLGKLNLTWNATISICASRGYLESACSLMFYLSRMLSLPLLRPLAVYRSFHRSFHRSFRHSL